jgi:glyoxylase-like metal-dependent hydrolase (beta-lactamase superfamily II)
MFHMLRSLAVFFTTFAACVAATAQTVGYYTSPEKTFSTASYWVAGESGVVLIDTQFLPKEGLEAVTMAEKVSGKKVTHAIVLHPNPDKFNGTESMKARGIEVITSKQVSDAIPGVHRIRTGWFAQEFAPDYPAAAAQPRVFGSETMMTTLAGVAMKLHVLGQGCSAAHVVAQVGDSVFVGDLVNPDNHAWLELGTIDEWLKRLEEIRAMNPKRVFPGRGKPGGIELIDKQAEYLRFVQQTVRDAKPSGELGTMRKLMMQLSIERKYSSLGYPGFMRDGLAAVWRVEAAKK